MKRLTTEQKILKTIKEIKAFSKSYGSVESEKADRLHIKIEKLIDSLVFGDPDRWEAFCEKQGFNFNISPESFF